MLQIIIWEVICTKVVRVPVDGLPVYQLVIRPPDEAAPLKKVAHVVVPLGDQLEGLLDDLLLLALILNI